MKQRRKRFAMLISALLFCCVCFGLQGYAADYGERENLTRALPSPTALLPDTGSGNTSMVPVSLKLNKTTTTMNLLGKSVVKLKAHGKNIADRKIIWKSNRNRVVQVSQKGEVTAKNKGTAVVTARISGTTLKAACKVEVQKYKLMWMRTTGYCNCRRCAGKWAGGPTASGRMPRANHTIAVDKRLIKLGTKVQIGNTMYTAEDTGSGIRGNRIDIYYSSHGKAQRHGVKYQMAKVFY